MSNLKKSLLTLSAAAAVTGMIAATAPAMAGSHAKNPCAAKAKMNPCKANPCAAKKMNPCKANPCAAKKMNPCKAK
jgi:hypothetical protein